VTFQIPAKRSYKGLPRRADIGSSLPRIFLDSTSLREVEKQNVGAANLWGIRIRLIIGSIGRSGTDRGLLKRFRLKAGTEVSMPHNRETFCSDGLGFDRETGNHAPVDFS
jgi:hypothetical protein